MPTKQLLLSRLRGFDHFLSDVAIAFCYNPNPTVSTPCPRSVDQTWLYSGLSNEILISAPLLLQSVLQ